jgi:hypothetical protein
MSAASIAANCAIESFVATSAARIHVLTVEACRKDARMNDYFVQPVGMRESAMLVILHFASNVLVLKTDFHHRQLLVRWDACCVPVVETQTLLATSVILIFASRA